MAKILVIGNPQSVLVRQRSLVGQQAGHQIFWVSEPKVNLPNVTAYGLSENISGFKRALLAPISLSLAIRSIQPDLIHVHYASQGLRTLPLLYYARCPIIVSTMGGDILPEQDYHGLHAYLVRALLNRANYITSKSEFMDATLTEIGNYKAKIKRVTWGIDLDRFCPNRDVDYLRRQWDIRPTDLVFFDVRSAALPLYNKHVILDGFAAYLQAGGPPAILLVAELASDPTHVARSRQQAADLGIADQVRFVGALDYAVIPDYYVLADATISVPKSDGFPQTIYEALACGSFLILGDLPQYAGAIEDGVTARLVPVGHSEALAQALLWIARRPNVRAQAANIGRTYVRQHADRQVQNRLMNQLYAELLTNGSG